MSLSLMLYLADVSQGATIVIGFIGTIAAFCALGLFMSAVDEYRDEEKSLKKIRQSSKFLLAFVIAAIVFSLLPSQKTVYLIIGANAAESVIENPNVKQISGRVFDILNKKLDEIDPVKKEEKSK